MKVPKQLEGVDRVNRADSRRAMSVGVASADRGVEPAFLTDLIPIPGLGGIAGSICKMACRKIGNPTARSICEAAC